MAFFGLILQSIIQKDSLNFSLKVLTISLSLSLSLSHSLPLSLLIKKAIFCLRQVLYQSKTQNITFCLFLYLQDSAKVVINCFAGLSRSSSGIITYLVLHKELSAMAALKIVKEIRDIYPNNSNLAHVARIHNEVFC